MDNNCKQRNHRQGIFERCISRPPVSDGQEQSASQAAPRKQSEFMVEDIGVLVAAFQPGDHIDYLQLDRIIGKIQQRLGQQKTSEKDQYTQRR